MKINNIDEFKQMEIGVLTDKLVRLHRKILNEKRFQTDKVYEGILFDKSFINTLQKLFKELKHHIYKEEKILFPYLINLSKSFKKGIHFEQPYFESVRNPIEIMKSDHELINEYIIKLKSSLYQSETESTTKNQFTERLKKFFDEIEKVIYLENEVLFPVAVQIEKSLLND